jgi:hypothetical protein
MKAIYIFWYTESSKLINYSIDMCGASSSPLLHTCYAIGNILAGDTLGKFGNNDDVERMHWEHGYYHSLGSVSIFTKWIIFF